MKKITINNMPTWAWNKLCVTARWVDGVYWFYDAWDDDYKAMDQTWEEELDLIYIRDIAR